MPNGDKVPPKIPHVKGKLRGGSEGFQHASEMADYASPEVYQAFTGDKPKAAAEQFKERQAPSFGINKKDTSPVGPSIHDKSE